MLAHMSVYVCVVLHCVRMIIEKRLRKKKKSFQCFHSFFCSSLRRPLSFHLSIFSSLVRNRNPATTQRTVIAYYHRKSHLKVESNEKVNRNWVVLCGVHCALCSLENVFRVNKKQIKWSVPPIWSRKKIVLIVKTTRIFCLLSTHDTLISERIHVDSTCVLDRCPHRLTL